MLLIFLAMNNSQLESYVYYKELCFSGHFIDPSLLSSSQVRIDVVERGTQTHTTTTTSVIC